jgi:hypothetical protein
MRSVMHAKPIEGHQDRLNLAVLPAHKLAKTPGTDLLTLYPLPSFPHITPRPSAGIHIYKVESSEEASRERETGNRSPCAQSQHRRGGGQRVNGGKLVALRLLLPTGLGEQLLETRWAKMTETSLLENSSVVETLSSSMT